MHRVGGAEPWRPDIELFVEIAKIEMLAGLLITSPMAIQGHGDTSDHRFLEPFITDMRGRKLALERGHAVPTSGEVIVR